MKKLTAIGLFIFLTACVAQPPEWTREKQAEVTTRSFQNISAQTLEKQAEKILRLADQSDIRFEYGAGGFTATRSFFSYFVIGAVSGEYTFEVRTSDHGSGSSIEVRVYSNLNSIGAAGEIGGNGGTFIQSSGLYDLFFSRLDVLVGKSNEWISCDQAKTLLGAPPYSTEALCLNADDKAP